MPVVGMEDDMLKPTLAVAFSDPCVLLMCCACAAQANLLCVSVTGEQAKPAGMEGECQSRMGVHSPLPALLFPCGMGCLPLLSVPGAVSLCPSSCWQYLWLLCLCTVKMVSRVTPGSMGEHWWWRGKGRLVLASLTSNLGEKGGK